MNNLANYNYDLEEDYEMAMKYYLMVIELNHSVVKFNLAKLNENLDKSKKLENLE